FNTRYFDYDQPEGPVLSVLGQPSYSRTASGTTLQDSYTPDGFLVNDLETRRYGLTAGFEKAQLQWSPGYHYNNLDEAAGYQPQTRTRATKLEAGRYHASKYSV